MRELPHLHVAIALLRDGFHPDSPGGTVTLDGDGAPVLDYPLTPYVWNGVRQAFRTMAELQFAAGARTVMPIHGEGVAYDNPAKARAAIDRFALAPLVTPVVSAHVMGGCPLGSEPARAAVDPTGRYHHLANLHVLDGSLFPTSLGANPQLSIYAIVARLATGLATGLRGITAGRPIARGQRAPISVFALTKQDRLNSIAERPARPSIPSRKRPCKSKPSPPSIRIRSAKPRSLPRARSGSPAWAPPS